MIKLVLLVFILSLSVALAKKLHWSRVEGQLRELVVARDFDTGKPAIYGLTSSEEIWTCRLPCDGHTNKWTRIPGNGVYIAANEQEVWVTGSDYSIWRCPKPCTSRDSWKRVGGQLRTIALGPEVAWGVNHYDDVFRATVRPKQPIQWEHVPGGKFKWVSVGQDNDVWGVLKSGDIARFAPKDKTWKTVPGKAKRISVGSKNLFIVDDDDRLFKCKRPCASGKWKQLDGRLRVVASEVTGARTVYGLKPDNSIVKGEFERSKCPKAKCSKAIAKKRPYNPWMWWWMWKQQQQQYPHTASRPASLWSNTDQQSTGSPSWTQYMQYLQSLNNVQPQQPQQQPQQPQQPQPPPQQVMPWWAQLPPWNWNQH